MQCSRVFQPSFCTPMAFHWPVPVRTLWPETRPIVIQMENDILRQMEEMQKSMDFMDQVHQLIFKKIEAIAQGTKLFDAKPIPYKTEKEGNRFALTLDTKDFSPEELTVKQVGRKLRVTGKHEEKEEDGKGGYAFKYQEFRQELELPEDVNPDEVTCSLSNGQLQIEVPYLALPAVTERTVPINTGTAVTERTVPINTGTAVTERTVPINTGTAVTERTVPINTGTAVTERTVPINTGTAVTERTVPINTGTAVTERTVPINTGTAVTERTVPINTGTAVTERTVPINTGTAVTERTVPINTGTAVTERTVPINTGTAVTERTVPINTGTAVKTQPERSTEEQEMTSSAEKEQQVEKQGA